MMPHVPREPYYQQSADLKRPNVVTIARMDAMGFILLASGLWRIPKGGIKIDREKPQ